MTWTADTVRQELHAIAAKLGWDRLPEGELSASLDSVQRLSLVVEIEDRFGIVFEPEDDAADAIDEVIRIILRRLAEGDAAPADG